MIGSVSTSRRAHAFAEAVDEHDRGIGEVAADGDHEQAQLLALADGLGSLPRPEMDPEVKTVQRAQLVAAMEAAVAEGTLGAGDGLVPRQRSAQRGKGAHRATGSGPFGLFRPTSRLGKGLAAGGLSVGVAASALGGVAAASTDALPGDTLYGLKRGMEDLRLDLADDDADRGLLYLDHASTRMREARRLVEQDRTGNLDHEALADIRRALSGVSHDAGEGHRLLSAAYERDGGIGVMQSLSTFTQDHRVRWAELRGRLPVQLSDVEEEVTEVFTAIEHEVEPLRALFPDPPVESGPAQRNAPGGEQRGADRSGSPSAESSQGERRDRDSEGDRPRPSGSSSQQDDGLLDDGLLDEPSSGPSKDSSRPGSGRDGGERPGPDITLPPLVPDVLPGLGVETRDD
ncbi:hypothetical protein E4198_10700 [Streptomyces sp. RKND-216]|uniref:DUF5667 domain-containing protein n=1 Tax=Streptomyces sp. RKND-216 TaxID=2562581 RepID=UPI00109E327E|nr:DUF5667 domain-containing protein [Streptomyces sp. RKND-216]THA25135.1 hypothetical protein E4198_10700 [Streptomyces sp. RKND-216]